MYTLYYSPGAASLVVHWLLIEIGAKHELRKLDLQAGEHKKADYLSLNPNGVVPTLLVHGEPLTEAAALVLHLADTHPSFGLAPEPGSIERGRYYQWILHLANTLQPAFRTWFYPAEAAGEANAEEAKALARERIDQQQNFTAHCFLLPVFAPRGFSPSAPSLPGPRKWSSGTSFALTTSATANSTTTAATRSTFLPALTAFFALPTPLPGRPGAGSSGVSSSAPSWTLALVAPPATWARALS